MTAGTAPRKRIFLHIGAPKTGTTYLQHVLWRNREDLARHGVLYPGDAPHRQWQAALDLLDMRFLGHADPKVPGSWERVVAETRSWQGDTVVISHEMLAWASADRARHAVESLAPAVVHVVYTARDLGRQIPAVWQESIKNKSTQPFERYLHDVQTLRERAEGEFWGAQDAVAVLRRWSTAVPRDRVHLVTVPPPGSPQNLLWERFAGLLGLDPAAYDATGTQQNTSLGAAEATLLRRLNLAVGDDIGFPIYHGVVKHHLAQRVLSGRGNQVRIAVPARLHPWVEKESHALVSDLRHAGYDVVGDLDELLGDVPGDVPGDDAPGTVDDIGADRQLDVAVDALVALLRHIEGQRQANATLRHRVGDLEDALSRQPTERLRTLAGRLGPVRRIAVVARALRRRLRP